VSFFARLFGFFFRSAAPQPVSRSIPAAANRPAAKPAPGVFVGWNELIDSNARIAGYLLRIRSLQADKVIEGDELLAAMEGERVLALAAQRPVIVPLNARQWQSADFRRLIAPQTYFLITDDSLSPAGDAALGVEIRSAGGKVARRLVVDGTAAEPCPADLLILNFQGAALPAWEAMLKRIRQRDTKVLLVADEVDSWSAHRLCLSLGIHYSTGQFAATPDEAEQTERLSQSRLVVIQMLNLLRSDAEPAEIVATAKRDPAIVLKLLGMANSPVHGLSRPVASLDEAIVVLGRDVLYRWLAVAMFRIDARDGRDQTLLVIALSRACFLESLLRETDKRVADELFLVGLLSVIESLLAMPMARIIQQMNLPDTVSSALLKNEGPYARYLMLVMAMERCRLDQAVVIASALQVDMARLIHCYGDAMTWATAELLDPK
jgi:EAL and modified HD-GYP domain-containing signal transduction protein